MSVQAINHINIVVTPRLMEAVRNFYVDVIGLDDGERPHVGIPGHWLYSDSDPILHLMVPRSEIHEAITGSGTIDHIALTCNDFPGMLQRIERAGVSYQKRVIEDEGFAQLFVTDPAGVKVELNFQF